MDKRYTLWNNLLGWITFAIAAVVYLMTIEPTASFWDCGEYITTAFKLEVGHPPGNPFFMILGNFFTLFAGGNVSNVAKTINALSGIASAFTIMFLFWSITHMAKKLVGEKEGNEFSIAQMIGIFGSGLVGALTYTFSDTFWFSAVEGEVYALSSLLTAMVFWAILKWENIADEPHANRWLVLIAYLVGLSIGIHLLNLLAIPAIVLVYYFKKHEATTKGVISALLLSGVLLVVIMYGIIPGVPAIASWFELIFVNTFGLPYHSGAGFYIVLLIAFVIWGIQFTTKRGMVIWNTILVSFAVIFIGYSSFAMVIIRSEANPPMDQNNPNDVFSLISYLNREQYGDRPLFYGQCYNAPYDKKTPTKKGRKIYLKKDGKYVVADQMEKPVYDSKFCSLFPRMYSSQAHHVSQYKSWANIKGTKVRTQNRQGEPETIVKPTFGENLKFFFRYQLNYMYFRYFMWNFAGRQNDIQGHGEITKGNWISGISAFDNVRLGDQDKLPGIYGSKNRANNKYYFLPLILGLLGAFFQYNRNTKGKKDFWVVMLLFVLTGLAIVVYLNQTPMQPRERDYAYAGSFYAFTIWIGLGVLAVAEGIRKFTPASVSAGLATVICLIAVPTLLASENWDDHDRSGRYTARDFGRNYLSTCEPNAIIFTNGDNDTFPLWYNQEVEGFRTDVRVCNLSYLQTDWYIDQMKRRAYKSAPLPISMEHEKFEGSNRNVTYLMEDPRIKGAIELKKAINFVANDDPRTKYDAHNGEPLPYIPSKKLTYTIDSAQVVEQGVVKPENADLIIDSMDINLNRQYLGKDELMILDMIAHNNWERPIYWAVTVGHNKHLNLSKYFQLEGFAYRLVPIKTENEQGGAVGRVATNTMYDNMMNKFQWGNMNDPHVYLDENNQRMCLNIRNNFSRLAGALISEGKKDSAVQVLDRCLEVIPGEKVPHSYFSIFLAENYFKAGANEKGENILRTLLDDNTQAFDFYFSLNRAQQGTVMDELQRSLYVVREIMEMASNYKSEETAKEAGKVFQEAYKHFQGM